MPLMKKASCVLKKKLIAGCWLDGLSISQMLLVMVMMKVWCLMP